MSVTDLQGNEIYLCPNAHADLACVNSILTFLLQNYQNLLLNRNLLYSENNKKLPAQVCERETKKRNQKLWAVKFK